MDTNDRFWKVCPLFDQLNKTAKKYVKHTEMVPVDKAMISILVLIRSSSSAEENQRCLDSSTGFLLLLLASCLPLALCWGEDPPALF
jgi:hypothetical protein